ncbi:MAG: TrkH family potassium uptake protein [Rikenellaceae bacterium]
MFISLLVSIVNDFDTGFFPLLMSTFLTFMMGVFPFVFVTEVDAITKKESYVVVAGSWILSCVIGFFPYILWGGEFTLVDAIFESVSGYTTTGSTILNDIEALPKSLIFWRSSTHLLGGAGVVVFAMALVPMLSKARASLSNVELSPFVKDNFKYKMQKAIHVLIGVYALLIICEALLLKIAGMTWFDAINHAFSTVATGGFSTKNLSIAYFDSIWIEVIIMFFMILSSVHFGLLYATFTGKRPNLFSSEVVRYYIISMFLAIGIITLNLWSTQEYAFFESLRYGSFQFLSVVTTTGFATIDSALWPPLSVALIILFSFQCGCAGSTAGGIKADRVLVLLKTFRAEFRKIQHPDAIIRLRLSGQNVSNDLVHSTLIFAFLFVAATLVGTFFAALMGVDIITALTGSVASISNIGPGFGGVSSMSNYDGLPDSVKIVFSILMLVGRLELYGFLQLFFIDSWK